MSLSGPTSKRHISFYSKEYATVCSGMNLKSRCCNTDCQSVRSLGGLVMVKLQDVDSCVYQDVVYGLMCPSCGSELSPQQFAGVVFVRCEAKISIGAKSVVFKATCDETVFWEMKYEGPEVRISVLGRESEDTPSATDVSRNYLFPTTGVNLVGSCSRQDCLAFKDNQGLVVVRVGLIESAVFQDLVKFRNCSCCNRELRPECFKAITFLGCRAEVEIGGKIETFNATSTPKPFKLEFLGPKAVVRVKRGPPIPPRPLSIRKRNSTSLDSPSLPVSPVSPGSPGVLAGFEKFLKNVSSGLRNLSSTLEPGINFMAVCPSDNCDTAIIPAGHITSCKYKEAIRGQSCPSCHQPLPPGSFKGVGFLQCKASVRTGGMESTYQAGRIVEICKISPSGEEVEISVLERETGAETTGQLSEGKGQTATRVCCGLNVEAMCINPQCAATIVVIPCPRVDECQYAELITTLKCPSCYCSIAQPLFIGISLVKCRAEVTIGSKYQTVSAVGDETKDFRLEVGGPPVTIRIVGRDMSARPGRLRGGAGMGYARACVGLNVVAICKNHECLAYTENEGQVNIKLPGISNCTLSDVTRDLSCPSCNMSMPHSQIKAITFVRCTGEVRIGGQTEKFSAAGDNAQHFSISPEGPEVRINISTQASEDQQPIDRKYTKVCDGLNFIAFCENASCLSVKDYGGYVSVKRDEKFVRNGGFQANRCRYSVEVQSLKCPACGVRLNPKIARGVAMVRCMGTIEIGGKSQNFEAKMNDFVEFNLDCSDPRTVIEFEVVSLLMHGPGLNFIARCPNASCPCHSNPLLKDVVMIKFGIVIGCRVNEAVTSENCPVCKHNIPIDRILAMMFNMCTAVVRIDGEVTKYSIGSRVDTIPFELSQNIEVDTLPVKVREVSLRVSESFATLVAGLNVQAVCSNRNCEAKRTRGGRVSIGCPEMKKYHLKDLFLSLKCPSCSAPLSELLLLCLSFVQCKALVETAGRKHKVEAAEDEAIDFEIDSVDPDLSILVLGLDSDIPESVSKKRAVSKGSDFCHSSLCHGMNFRAACVNPSCVSVQDGQFVNIMAGHLLDFDYRSAIRSLTCPACETAVQADKVRGATLLCCTGEVRIGGRVEKFDYGGDRISGLDIPHDGSPVRIRMEHRTYDVITHPVFPYMSTPFKSLCNGLNFRSYCKNRLCGTFKEREGLVMIQRDQAFADLHGYAAGLCNYRQEIANLRCPDCGNRIKRYYVWGVAFTCCSGTITRDGSPPEKFSTLLGKVVLYALDRDDASVRIQFTV